MGVSKNRGGHPKSSILIRFSIINHPFLGCSTPIFGNIQMLRNGPATLDTHDHHFITKAELLAVACGDRDFVDDPIPSSGHPEYTKYRKYGGRCHAYEHAWIDKGYIMVIPWDNNSGKGFIILPTQTSCTFIREFPQNQLPCTLHYLIPQ